MPEVQRWIVGVDLRERSDGAVRFAAWLRAQAQERAELIGVHAIAHTEFLAAHRPAERVRVREQHRLAAERTIARAEASHAFAGIEIVESDDPEAALETTLAVEAAHGIIVGRRAAGATDELVRLGSVARRLLRRLVAPTFVVAPDIEPGRLGEGPIVVAVTPTPASTGALATARSLAAGTGRKLLFVHVAPVPEPTAAGRRARSDLEATTRAWLAGQGQPGPPVIRIGEEIVQLLATAAEHAAPLLVCGSRRLGTLERVFETSLSSQLAAQAAIPVLVAPPDVTA